MQGKDALHPCPPEELSALGRICPALAIPRAADRSLFGVFSQDITVLGSCTWYPLPRSATSPPSCVRPSGFYSAVVLPGKFVERADVSHPQGTSKGRAVAGLLKLGHSQSMNWNLKLLVYFISVLFSFLSLSEPHSCNG